MARIVEDFIMVKFSKLVKDEDNSDIPQVTNELRQAIEIAIQDLAAPGVIIEVERK